jgi:DNA-binding response OmpR family regulator
MMCGGRILIIEDDFLIAEQIRQILVQGGYDVVGMAGRTKRAEEHGADLAIVNLKLEVDVDGGQPTFIASMP